MPGLSVAELRGLMAQLHVVDVNEDGRIARSELAAFAGLDARFVEQLREREEPDLDPPTYNRNMHAYGGDIAEDVIAEHAAEHEHDVSLSHGGGGGGRDGEGDDEDGDGDCDGDDDHYRRRVSDRGVALNRPGSAREIGLGASARGTPRRPSTATGPSSTSGPRRSSSGGGSRPPLSSSAVGPVPHPTCRARAEIAV